MAWGLQSGLVHVRGFADPSALVASYQIMPREDVMTEDKTSEASTECPSYFGWLSRATQSLPGSCFYHWVPPTDSCWIPHFAQLASGILCTYPWSKQTACVRLKHIRLKSCSLIIAVRSQTMSDHNSKINTAGCVAQFCQCSNILHHALLIKS